jgi:hypothetical protein
MEAAVMLAARVEQLLAYFNRGTLDVPDGLFDKNAVLTLNGVPYEMRLGRSADDPLIRLIARGPAGYRFIANALLHALDRASATVGTFDVASDGAAGTILLQGWPRGSTDRFEEVLDFSVTLTPSGSIHSAHVTMPEDALVRLKEARAS